MTKKTRWLLILIFLLFCIAIAGVAILRYLILMPYKAYSEPKIAVTVIPGSSVTLISETLANRGVLRHPWLLKGLFIAHGTQGQSKAGDYVFDRPLSPLQVYEKLLKGEMQYTLLSIVEGQNVFDIETTIVERGIATAQEFREVLLSEPVRSALSSIDPEIVHAEGFLFPETYFLTKRESYADRVVQIMIRQFKKQFGSVERARAAELRMSVLQVVTLASLIEKETGVPSERPLVSGVFHNRLNRGMLLQCDPTVIYAFLLAGNYDGHLSRPDLQIESPYNTYVSAGLPPGPICNPGKASILAALYPQQTEMLYFVSKNDGTHHFSTTLQEHYRAVRRYRNTK